MTVLSFRGVLQSGRAAGQRNSRKGASCPFSRSILKRVPCNKLSQVHVFLRNTLNKRWVLKVYASFPVLEPTIMIHWSSMFHHFCSALPELVEAKIDELLMRFGNFWCLVGMCFVLVKSMVSRRPKTIENLMT